MAESVSVNTSPHPSFANIRISSSTCILSFFRGGDGRAKGGGGREEGGRREEGGGRRGGKGEDRAVILYLHINVRRYRERVRERSRGSERGTKENRERQGREEREKEEGGGIHDHADLHEGLVEDDVAYGVEDDDDVRGVGGTRHVRVDGLVFDLVQFQETLAYVG